MTSRKLSREEQWLITGKVLKAARKMRRVTQDELADNTEVQRTTISAVERGKRGIPDEHLEAIAKALGIPSVALVPPNALEEAEIAGYAMKQIESLSARK